jgi:hypothetical protein
MDQWGLRSARPCLEELEGRLVPSAVSTTSTNWSGYAVNASAGAVTAVSGSWVVPTVTGSGTAYSSDWVGIDGYNSPTVEQIGTDSDIVNGTPQYYAWYEMYPKGSVQITSLAVHAGDTISASVTSGAGGFTLSLTDATTGKSFSTTQTAAGAQRSSAEWVVEAPSSGFGILSLANFGKVNFTAAQATISGKTGPVDYSGWAGSQLDLINMVSPRSGAAEDSTSTVTDSGSPTTSAFTVTYTASTTTTTPTPPHHHGWWWFATDQSATTTSTTVAAATASSVVGALLSATPRLAQSPLAATTQQTALAATPVAAVTVAAPTVSLPQSPIGGAGRSSDVGDPATGQADQPAGPEALPAPGESGTPADQSAQPSNPDGAPAAGESATRACDACFMDGGAVVMSESAGELTGSAGETGLGLALALVLTGTWGAGRDRGPTRRHRLKPPTTPWRR